ncbi:MAG: putative zinc-binding protein [Chloroflexota bacterium]
MSAHDKAIVIPCSGIGKVFGSVGREATYIVVDELRPKMAETLCLSLLVVGDQETVERVRGVPCIAVDGCPKACAQKNIELAGGVSAASLRVVDTYKAHRELKPEGVTVLDESGRKLARFLAQEIASAVDRVVAGR